MKAKRTKGSESIHSSLRNLLIYCENEELDVNNTVEQSEEKIDFEIISNDEEKKEIPKSASNKLKSKRKRSKPQSSVSKKICTDENILEPSQTLEKLYSIYENKKA